MGVLIFLLTYVGVAVGRFPRLAIDRTGIALLGAIAMVVGGVLTADEAFAAIHVPTLLLLYGLMIVSAQLRLGGFYTRLARDLTTWLDRPAFFLFLLMTVSGGLAAILANDIICLAFTPVLCVALRRRGLNPIPFLLGLAMGTNLGSASTIIGNPQSMLIGQLAQLDFKRFFFWCAPPSFAGLLATWGLLLWLYRGRLRLPVEHPPGSESADGRWPPYNRRQTIKGLIAVTVVIGLLLTRFPREWSVLAVAAVLLLSRQMHTRSILGLVDWHLITLFASLFIVVRGLNASGWPERIMGHLETSGLAWHHPIPLSFVTVVLSNVVSNVPATVLLCHHLPLGDPIRWYVLSVSATFSGNLLPIGSIANLIVIEQAFPFGVSISLREYARSGIPITLVNLAILILWILIRS
jgi:Na+/H+ antiporter NhaD/arsenite permease-like protein